MDRAATLKAKSTRLSSNFTLYEMIGSSSHPELVQYPSEEVINHLKNFCETVLQPLRDKFGPIRVNSGYRNAKLNKRVGGVSNSVHLIIDPNNGEFLGVAADIVPTKMDIIDAFEYIARNAENVKTAIIYRKPAVTRNPFIHIDTRVSRKTRAILEKTTPNTYVDYVFRGE